jgi:hypothetical protein
LTSDAAESAPDRKAAGEMTAGEMKLGSAILFWLAPGAE